MKRLIVSCVGLLAFALLAVSCGDDNSTGPTGDVTAPAAISDLEIVDSVGTAVHLQWTATGDDDTAGTAAVYEIRMADEPLTEGSWDSATPVGDPPVPAAAGTGESLEIEDMTWWTRCHFGIRVRDDAGNWSDISNIVACHPCPDPDWRFLIDTRDGMIAVDMEGDTATFIESARWVEIRDGHVYTGSSSIDEYDFNGTFLRNIRLPAGVSHYGWAALPGERFAMLNNWNDTVYFVDDEGNLLAARGMLIEPNESLQNMDGVVVGNDLIISEDGGNHLLRANLTTYEITQFRDLTSLPGWLGAIDYYNGRFCICQGTKIWHFEGEGAPELIAEIPQGNITGAVMIGGHTFFVINHTGQFQMVNNTTGEITTIVEGLDYPQDMDLMMR
ncbi:MAG: hypothetical protein AB1752_06690, partial [Candidatus Zixiibacteriota bacterium]